MRESIAMCQRTFMPRAPDRAAGRRWADTREPTRRLAERYQGGSEVVSLSPNLTIPRGNLPVRTTTAKAEAARLA